MPPPPGGPPLMAMAMAPPAMSLRLKEAAPMRKMMKRSAMRNEKECESRSSCNLTFK